jgi:TolB-like protein/tetratricopeptide (TPR) repeat protein
LLTGRLPYRGTEDVPVGIQHINAPVPQLPPPLADYQGLVDSLMAKAPAARPVDGAQVARRIEAMQAGATPMSTPTVALPPTPLPDPRSGAKWLRLAVAATLLVVAVGLLWRYLPAPAPESGEIAQYPATATARAADIATKASESSIAVLPLRNEGGAAEDVYFSDGLSEDLITALGQLEGVRVISRNSSFRFRDASEASERIASQLGVAYLVEGSVRRAGDAVRMNISLVRASDGSTAWSQRFDRPYRDVFALQDEIVGEVTRALGARLRSAPLPANVFDRRSGGGPVSGGGARAAQRDKPPSGNMAAYEALLRGNHELEAHTDEGAAAAIKRFEQAIRLDPAYARAWASLAVARYQLANFYIVDLKARSQLNEASVQAASTALRLDPNLASAHLATGLVLQAIRRDFAAAEPALRRAAELAPQDPAVLSQLATLVQQRGGFDEAEAIARRALAADPLSAEAHHQLARILSSMTRYAEAEAEFQRCVELRPQGSMAHANIAIARALDGRGEAAVSAAREEVDPFWRDYALALAYFSAGRRAQADAALDSLVRHHSEDAPFQIAIVHAHRGEVDAMFQWLERAYATGDSGVTEVRESPFFRRFHADPRFQSFCRNVGLPAPSANATGA